MSRSLVVFIALAFHGSVAFAAPKVEDLPPDLKPWTSWVLRGHEEKRCPFFHGRDARRCQWPSALTVQLVDSGGRFEQQWEVYAPGFVSLPGDAKHWPQDVRVNGKPAIVVPRNAGPHLRLSAGTHRISGAFRWTRLPDSLAVPVTTGLLRVSVAGKSVSPRRDAAGRLLLRGGQRGAVRENSLEVTVHRRVVDQVPLLLETRIKLDVSGKSREETLGRALPKAFVLMQLTSALPARLDPDGLLRVQVRAGTWEIGFTARHPGHAVRMQAPESMHAWPKHETWVFEARPAIRLVDVQGPSAVDPQQTTLPDPWKRLPAYRLSSGQAMVMAERRRGDSDPPPDRLTLKRRLWLDFDGQGMTIADHLSGTLSRQWRLNMGGETQLGRVAVGNKQQFITRSGAAGIVGVEVRQTKFDLEADSRYQGDTGDIPAVGWAHDFQRVSATLLLPPGWRLFYSWGADEAPGSWLERWSLFDLFLLLLLALTVGKLYGWPWGVLALLTLSLIFPEPQSPRWVWAFLLAAEGLGRVLPVGWLKRWTGYARLGIAVLLLLISIPFALQQIRQGLFPTLERPHSSIARSTAHAPARRRAVPKESAGTPAPIAAVQPLEVPAKPAADKEESDGELEDELAEQKVQAELTLVKGKRKADLFKRGRSSGRGYGRWRKVLEQDPDAVVQTGPGLPAWNWRALHLTWNGPVDQQQRLKLWLIPPWLNLLLSVLRTLLLTILIVVVARFRPKDWSGLNPSPAVAVLLLLMAPSARAEVPSANLLEQLRIRLLEPADCFPNCATFNQLQLEAASGELRLRVQASAAARTAVPLPGHAKHWMAQTVRVGGRPAQALGRIDDTLWVVLPSGNHRIEISGRLDQATVQIPFALRPHFASARLRGWTLEGLHEDGLLDQSLQLTRVRSAPSDAKLKQSPLVPFVRVSRRLRLGLTWSVETSIERLTPPETAAVFELPLLEGESVTTAGIRVKDGKVLVNLAANATQMRWRSVLGEKPSLKLDAPAADRSWVEVWNLEASPVWHVQPSGIPPVAEADHRGPRRRQWRPWPGEKVELAISRPKGLAGQVQTIDGATLEVTPGLRASDATLRVVIRSSRGARHTISLPPKADLQQARIGGRVLPLRAQKGNVNLPLSPGKQIVELSWRDRNHIQGHFSAPRVDLGLPVVNAAVTVRPPHNRWILWAGGAPVGPAVMFWSLIAVLILVSVALGRVRLTPLGTLQWLLLSIGLSQVPIFVAAVVPLWLLAVGWRKQTSDWGNVFLFDLRQLFLVGMGVAALLVLVGAVHQGLLGTPDMQILGNGSHRALLSWYTDRTAGVLPQPWVVSVPMFVYRVLMLTWALWLAWALIRWLRWVWSCLSEGQLWRRSPKPAPRPAPPTAH